MILLYREEICMVLIYTEATGWISVDLTTFYKSSINGEMASLSVWNFKSYGGTMYYAILRKHIQAIKGPEDSIKRLEK